MNLPAQLQIATPWVRWCAAGIGLLFLLGAVNKLADPAAAMGHLPFSFARPVQLSFVLALELVVGLALILSPSRGTVGLAFLLLLAFSLYLLSIIRSGELSCGCFDALGIRRPPWLALLTNLAALGGLSLCRRHLPAKPIGRELGLILVMTVLSAGAMFAWSRSQQSQIFPPVLGPQAAGRDILLKISPTCEACHQATQQVLSRYPARRVIAVTYVNVDRFIQEYVEQFQIPLMVLGVQEFFALGGTLAVPQCYQIQGTNLMRLPTATRK